MPEKKDSKQRVTLTREELSRQVWEIPMSRLAKEYGLSDTGLAKICRRLDVPYPPRGHWAKKAAGKKVPSSTLPAPRADTPEQITITPAAEPTPVAVPSPAMKSSMDAVRASLEISVPDRLLRPHKVVAGWIADYERRVQEARRQRDPWAQKHWKPTPFGDLDRRRHRILDALFKELERKGGAVGENDRKELYVEVNGERIELTVMEREP